MTQNQTVGDRLAAKIKDRAKANGRDSLDDLRRFALERVLVRLMAFDEGEERLLLKGGMLWWLDQGFASSARTTSDIDIHVFDNRTVDEVVHLFTRAGKVDAGDGTTFELGRPRTLEHTSGERPGARIPIRAWIGGVRVDVHADVGFGGRRPEEARQIELKGMVEGLPTARVWAVPWPYVVSEKLHALVDKGLVNTRSKDYRDLWILLVQRELPHAAVAAAIAHTFVERGLDIPADVPAGLTDAYAQGGGQGWWTAFLQRSRLSGSVPDDLQAVLGDLRPRAMDLFAEARELVPAPSAAPGPGAFA